ncbi:MAG TPA: undecaprenyl-diphosphate phosphatase [Clostridia bacterium]|nr:MAG: Undecaprenyl-diphosphatase [Firmicutes bacterium ADurb.Bin248]HOG00434.1 undecaprenyl-diphosphate phosphatase [Clostridia bacterium]HOS17844.1 undecaprenyl-diphosphate phosphatase [Clostridia bacterium]HPK16162.1 undecaprenyl-diphosphate phosphatase [Clostridia bacterium]
MNVLIAALLGLVQGLTEFLPVSSSGHLILMQRIFGIEEGALFFDTMLHIGTLVAVVAVFWRELWALVKKPLQKRVYMLALSSVVTAAIYFLLEDFFTGAFEGTFLGFGFVLTAAILFASEKIAKKGHAVERMKVPDALAVGLMQGVAILPGVSRSGSTIAGARVFGLSKEEAAQYSFLLSIPVILGAAGLQLPDAIRTGPGDASWLCVAVGALVAAASGYFAIRWMLRLIVRKGFAGFALYTLILGLAVLGDQYVAHIFF